MLSCWDDARRKGDFAIWAYVIMPEHVHLLIWPRSDDYEMAAILRALKESFAHWVVDYWSRMAHDILGRISVTKGTEIVHRFWQKGGGYDRNLYKWDSIQRAIEYIEANPVRRGLVTDPVQWSWSSARHRLGAANSPLVPDPVDVAGDGDAL